MFYNFCTLFDKNYLYKGLALYNSLKRNCNDFKLFILCMDDIAYNLLQKMDLEKVELISLEEFEDPELAKIKNTRTLAEYCWTCTASLILFLLKKYPTLKMMTYLDADLYFFSNPKPFFDEFDGNSIFITEHNLSREFAKLLRYGKYNVQFIIFRNDDNGLRALEWWRAKTIERCYSRRRGKDMQGGDQIYLNDWSDRFKGVHVLKNKKLCLAPWNANKYKVIKNDREIKVDGQILIFYHFHSFELNSSYRFVLADGAYKIDKSVKELIYQPYINSIQSTIKLVKEVDSSFNYGFSKRILEKRMEYSIKKLLYTYYRLINSIRVKL